MTSRLDQQDEETIKAIFEKRARNGEGKSSSEDDSNTSDDTAIIYNKAKQGRPRKDGRPTLDIKAIAPPSREMEIMENGIKKIVVFSYYPYMKANGTVSFHLRRRVKKAKAPQQPKKKRTYNRGQSEAIIKRKEIMNIHRNLRGLGLDFVNKIAQEIQEEHKRQEAAHET